MDKLPDYKKLKFRRVDMTDLSARYPTADPAAVAALKRLIRLNPCALNLTDHSLRPHPLPSFPATDSESTAIPCAAVPSDF